MQHPYDFRVTCHIQRRPSEVFRWLTDPVYVMRWLPRMIENEHQPPDDGGYVGTELRQCFRVFGLKVQSVGIVERYETDRLLGLRFPGAHYDAQVRYCLQPRDQATEISQEVLLAPNNRLGSFLSALSRNASPVFRKKMHRNLMCLKQTCEAEDDSAA